MLQQRTAYVVIYELASAGRNRMAWHRRPGRYAERSDKTRMRFTTYAEAGVALERAPGRAATAGVRAVGEIKP